MLIKDFIIYNSIGINIFSKISSINYNKLLYFLNKNANIFKNKG